MSLLWQHRRTCSAPFLLPCLSSSQVLPILEILYHVEDRNSHHVYMALIILLILTEDDAFNRSIHEVVGRHTLIPVCLHFMYCCCILSLFALVRINIPDFNRHFSLLCLSLPFTGTEEHLVVHREVIDRDLTWQFAHPGGHPHHPVQHDPDKGRFVQSKQLCFQKPINCWHFYIPQIEKYWNNGVIYR